MAVINYSSGQHKRSIFKSQLGTSGGQSVCVSSGCSMELEGGSTLALESDAKFKAAAGSTIDISGSAKLESGSRLNLMAGSSCNKFGNIRYASSLSATSNIHLSNHGISFVHFGTSGIWTGYLDKPTSGVEKTVIVSFKKNDKSNFRLNMGASGGSDKIGIGSTMRHSITFTSHAIHQTTAGGRGVYIKMVGWSSGRWIPTDISTTDATILTVTSATHAA